MEFEGAQQYAWVCREESDQHGKSSTRMPAVEHQDLARASPEAHALGHPEHATEILFGEPTC